MVRVRSKIVLLAASLLVVLLSCASTGSAAPRAAVSAPSLGPNVIVFDPSMPVSQIQATVDAIHARQVNAEMGTDRYALLFKPGVYGSAAQPLQMKVGYYTAGPQFASGGFIADSNLPFVINGSQQQWVTHDSQVAGWSNGVWNQVFAGVEGAPPETGFPNPPYTTLERTPVSREKPYLF